MGTHMLDPQDTAHTQQSLYKRLGGYDAIAGFVHDLMPRLRGDAALGPPSVRQTPV